MPTEYVIALVAHMASGKSTLADRVGDAVFDPDDARSTAANAVLADAARALDWEAHNEIWHQQLRGRWRAAAAERSIAIALFHSRDDAVAVLGVEPTAYVVTPDEVFYPRLDEIAEHDPERAGLALHNRRSVRRGLSETGGFPFPSLEAALQAVADAYASGMPRYVVDALTSAGVTLPHTPHPTEAANDSDL